MPNRQAQSRFSFLDQLRGIAIILMIIFHFCYDLNYFHFIDIDLYASFWYFFPRLITFMFLICVGIALTITHSNSIRWYKVAKRFGILAVCSAAISIATYIAMPDEFIYFGILHCIALSSIVALPFLNKPIIALIIGLPMIVLGVLFNINIPFFHLEQGAVDYIPLFPWIGAVLIGIFLGRVNLHKIKTPSLPFLEVLGRHSLIIYLTHQIALFGLVWVVWKIMPFI